MDDLISREELRKAFKESGYFTGPSLHWARLLIDIAPTVLHDNYSMGYQDGVKKVLSEKPQGEWEKPFLHSDGRWYHKCTNCHICSEVSILQDKYCNFCVNCGADMRGGRE